MGRSHDEECNRKHNALVKKQLWTKKVKGGEKYTSTKRVAQDEKGDRDVPPVPGNADDGDSISDISELSTTTLLPEKLPILGDPPKLEWTWLCISCRKSFDEEDKGRK